MTMQEAEGGAMQIHIRRVFVWAIVSGVFTAFAVGAYAQEAAPQPAQFKAIEVNEPDGQILSYRHLIGSTNVQMRGTGIEPDARIKLKVESRPGFLEIDINRGDIKGIQPARRFGKDFHAYVMWAVSVDGKASNLGEITFEGNRPISINVTTPYQTFWLMVTAEPDYAVADPSPLVVLYSINQDRVQTEAAKKAIPIPGKLLFYTHYTDYETRPGVVQRLPNSILQARKAVELASKAGILAQEPSAGPSTATEEGRARSALKQAREFLQEAENIYQDNPRNKDVNQFARTAAQIAENARALALGAVGGIFIRQLEGEVARVSAEAEGLRREIKEVAQLLGREKTQTGPLRERIASLEQAKLSAESQLADARQKLAGLEGRLGQLQTALEQERANSRDARSGASQTEEQLRALNQQVGAMQVELAQARDRIGKLSQERDSICGELRRQLASLGQLNDQGGNMVLTLASDILFDFGSYELRSTARENLAKLAVLGLLLFPDADVRYEGHTDLVGEEAYNQWLSEQRAMAVYRYFLEESAGHDPDPQARAASQTRLGAVQQLLLMNYASSTRAIAQRQQLIGGLGGAVLGKGEREPLVASRAAEERNRRVVLHFPPSQMGSFTSICEAPSAVAAQQ